MSARDSRSLKLAASISAVALVSMMSAGCLQQLKARDNLNRGVQSFKAGSYSQAVDYFKTAVDLDPSFPTARLYLATAYMSQYIPGADSPDNMKNAKAALDQFEQVLANKPNNQTATLATQSIASLYFQEKDFDKAEMWNRKVIALDPKNKEAYYTLGVIAWTKFLQPDRQARVDSKMKPEDPGPIKDPKTREEMKAKWLPILDQGVEDEKKSLAIDPQYEDAMAYLNLLIRYRADLLDSPAEWKKETEVADGWMQKSLDTKKVKAEKKAAADAGTGTVTK